MAEGESLKSQNNGNPAQVVFGGISSGRVSFQAQEEVKIGERSGGK